MSIDSIIDSIEGDPRYIRFLLLNQPYIRSSLLARGVCLDEEYLTMRFSDSIGNALHLDMIEVETWLSGLDPQSQRLIAQWVVNDRTPQEPYARASVRRRRSVSAARRVVADLSGRLSGALP